MLDYYIKTTKYKYEKMSSYKTITCAKFLSYLIIWLKYCKKYQTKLNYKLKFKLKSNFPSLAAYKTKTVFNSFLFFLSKHTINKQISVKSFIHKNETTNYNRYSNNYKKHNQKVPYQRWKFLKKQYLSLIKKTIKRMQVFNKNTKKLNTHENLKYSNRYNKVKFKNKTFFKNYKTKKKQLKSDFKNQYNNWVNNNYKKYFYVASIQNKTFFKKS